MASDIPSPITWPSWVDISIPGRITSSVAVGYLDGPGDTQLDIVVTTGSLTDYPNGPDSLWAFRADGTTRRATGLDLL